MTETETISIPNVSKDAKSGFGLPLGGGSYVDPSVPEDEGAAHPWLVIPTTIEYTAGEPVEYETELNNETGESQNCTGSIQFRAMGLQAGDVTWEQKDLMGTDTGWTSVDLQGESDVLFGAYGEPGFPIVAPMNGKTTVRATIAEGFGEVDAASFIYDEDGDVLTSTGYRFVPKAEA